MSHRKIGKRKAPAGPVPLPSGQGIRKITTVLCFIFFCTLLSLAQAQATSGEPDFRYDSVTGPCDLSFPKDHGPHPGFRTEWWYFTGNLEADKGERFGVQLTFFRSRIQPPGAELDWPTPPSAWRTSQIYLAHAAVSDMQNRRFLHEEDVSRAFPDLAGAVQDGNTTRIFVKNWFAAIGPEMHHLRAATDHFSMNIRLIPLRAPVLHGEGGYSRKGSTPERASCYYSITRLQAQGTLTISDRIHEVRGTAWMDHEFSSAPLEPGIVGWDWFSVQLSDNTELMLYFLRMENGRLHGASSGTFVHRDGHITPLPFSAIRLEVLDHWRSDRSGALYPSAWKLTIQPLDLDLLVHPNLQDQELLTPGTTGITYWEGSVSASGTAGGRKVHGVGYVELTGYAHPLDGRL